MERLKGIKMSILRMPEVKKKTGHRSHASIYNAIHKGLFTKPVRIGMRSVGWPSDEVDKINAARIAGKTELQIRELVEQLHYERCVHFVEIARSNG
jgi:prophage regulatory protein